MSDLSVLKPRACSMPRRIRCVNRGANRLGDKAFGASVHSFDAKCAQKRCIPWHCSELLTFAFFRKNSHLQLTVHRNAVLLVAVRKKVNLCKKYGREIKCLCVI